MLPWELLWVIPLVPFSLNFPSQLPFFPQPLHLYLTITFASPTWRSVFFLSTGLNVLCMIGGAFSIDRDQPSTEVDKRIDYIGAFLVTAGLTFIIFVLSDGSIAPQGWATPCMLFALSRCNLNTDDRLRRYCAHDPWCAFDRCLPLLATLPRETSRRRTLPSKANPRPAHNASFSLETR